MYTLFCNNMKLKIKRTTIKEIEVPKGTKVISKGEWLTLARKAEDDILIFTCPIDRVDCSYFSVMGDEKWTRMVRSELQDILKKVK